MGAFQWHYHQISADYSEMVLNELSIAHPRKKRSDLKLLEGTDGRVDADGVDQSSSVAHADSQHVQAILPAVTTGESASAGTTRGLIHLQGIPQSPHGSSILLVGSVGSPTIPFQTVSNHNFFGGRTLEHPNFPWQTKDHADIILVTLWLFNMAIENGH